MRLRSARRWVVPVVAVLAAIRCGGSDSFTPPDEGLPAHIIDLGGAGQAGVVGERLTDTLVVRITDSKDRPVKDQKILFQLIAGGTGSDLIPDTALTNSDGDAKSVWVLGHLAGQQRVEARVLASGAAGGLKQVFTATAQADTADTIFAVKGQGQQGLVSTILTDSLVVLVGDQYGNPIAAQTVNWSVPAGQGSISATTTVTGADGRAAVQRTLGPTAGGQTATAVWAANPALQVVFNSVAGAGGVARLVKVFGDNQTAPAGQRLTDSIVVRAEDNGGNGVSGRDVVWVISGGGGSLSSGSTTTDAQGKTYVRWTLGTTAGDNTATAAITGLPQVTFTAHGNAAQATKIVAQSTTTLTGPAAQAVSPAPSVKVTDNNNNGVQGVTVTFTVLTGGGTVSDGTGTGPSVTVATNANGIATVTSWILGGAAGSNNNTLSATATGAGITGNPITFTASAVAGSAAKLAFLQQPTNAQAGVAIAPAVTVQVQDLGGNPVPSSAASITVNLTTPGGATLGGTKIVAAVGGIATFSTLTVDKAATGYTLTATAPGLLNSVSGTFNISAGTATKVGFVVQPSTTGAGISIAPPVQVAVQDQFGNQVPTATNPITMAIGTNPAGGVLSGTTTVNAVAGIASFSTLKIDKTGTGYTLRATATSLTADTSASFNIGAGLPAKLAFQQQPSSVMAGAAITPAVTVLVQDAQGNTVPTATDSVFLAIGTNPGGALLTGNRVAAVNGIATFGGITLDKTGTGYTLVASGTGLASSAPSSAFNVTPGTGQRLVFGVQPSNVAAGSSITPEVTVQMLDALNNIVTTFTGQITLGFNNNPTNATLGGAVVVNAVTGVAHFSNLTVNKVGTGYTLLASNPSASPIVSLGFNVTPGGAAALTFEGQPPTFVPAVAGAAISPAVTVQVRDAQGNALTTSTASITIAIGLNPGASTLTGTVTVNAVGGLATFSNLILNKAANGYTLTASSGTLTPATSVAFNVRANDPSLLAFVQQPTNVAAGAAITPAVTVRVTDAFGNLTDAPVQMEILNNPGTATLSGTLSALSVNGIATFSNLSLNKAGTGYTLRAFGSALTATTSNPFNVTAGTATKLIMTVQPTNANAGVAIAPAIVVQIRDANDNIVTSTANVTMAISTNPGGATLSGTNPVAAAAGVATFSNLSLNRPGVGYVLTATSGSLTAAVSDPFVINPGAASVLVFTTQPTNDTTGRAITPAPTVTVRDALGNTVTGFVNPIVITIGTNPGGATLGGSITSVVPTNGVAVFANLALDRPGNGYTLVATTTGVTTPTVTSATFNMAAGAANKLAITVQPGNGVVGAALTPAIQVVVQDASGNIVPGATNSVSLTLVNNPSGAILSNGTVNAVAGTATFSNVRLDKAGANYTMIANSGGLAGSPVSNQFTITAAATTTTITGDAPDPSVVGQSYTVTTTVTSTGGTPTGNVTVSDGVATNTCAVGVGCPLTSTTAGAKTLTAIYAGDGNFAGSTSGSVAHTVSPAATTTAITGDNPDPSAVNVAFTVTYTVSVNAPGAGTPTGNVTVSDGAATNTCTVAAGSCPLTSTTTGAKTITATYATDGNFAGSVSTGVSHTVGATATVTTITGDTPEPSVVGQPVAVTYTVTGGATPTGNVTVVDGTGATNTCTVAAGTCSITPTTAGAKTIVATYGGDATHAGSASAGTPHTVNGASTTTTITSDTPDPSIVNTAYTVNFTVVPVAPGAGTPTGNVTVGDGTNTCTATVAQGTCQLISTTTGAKNLVATYATDGNFLGSTSGIATHQVDPTPAGAAIGSANPNPSVVGQGYTVSFSVTGGTSTPTGTVTVSDGAASCSAALSSGAGSCALTSTTAGSKNLTASYPGDGTHSANTSPPFAHTVSAAATSTSITSDTPDPSVVNVAYAVSYAVAVTAPGVGTPTGNVSVSDGTSSCTGTVAAGTCNLTSTSAGAKNLTATYAGDANFAGSVSTTAAHTVSTATTTTAITTDTPDPSVVGQSFAVNFTVTGGTTTPTGNVTVSDGAATCTGTVAAGTCTLTSTTAGTKSLVATYAGDVTHAGSTSAGASHQVNAAATTTTITGDSPDPSTVNTAYTVNYTVTANAPGAGTPTGSVTVSDGTSSCTGTVAAGTCDLTSTTTGSKTLTATYGTDGNFAGSVSTGVAHTVSTATTATTITSDTPDPSLVGELVTVNFSVTGAPGTPTGNVTVSDGTINCTGALSAGTGSCTLTFASAGPRTLTATYAGDGTHGGSVSTGVSHTVNAATTTTSITSDTPDPSVVGQAYPVAFTVTSAGGTPTGSVTVDDGSASCTATVAAGTCNVTSTTAGTKTLTATYTATTNFAGSTGTTSHQVSAAATTTTITGDSPDPSTVNTAYAVNYTVAVTAPGAGTPTGNVTVSDGAATCVGTVAAGSCNLTSTTTGAKTLTATYGTDGNFAGSVSTGVAHTVSTATTVTTITSDTPDPSLVGELVTVNFSVTGAPGTPTGNVTVSDGTINCSGALNVSGTGSCTLTFASAGARNLTATYSGDGSHGGSVSVTAAHAVNLNASSTIVSSSPDPSTFGQSVTLTATVSGAAGTPTGTVQFKDGVANLGSPITLVSGGASLATSALSVGSHSITGVYSGDGTYSTSTSSASTQTVNKAASTTGLGSSPNPSTVTESVTFTATVSGSFGTPTGTVQFKDGAANLGSSATLVSGVATLATSALSVGSHSITAVYSGDGTYNTSTSSVVTQTVDIAATTTAVSSSLNPSTFGDGVTFTATVSDGGAGTPTGGTVQFKVDNVNLGAAVSLSGGTATSPTTSSLSVGNHAVTADYSGSTNFALSSGTLSGGQDVNQASTTTTIDAHTPDPVTVNNPITIDVSVTSGGGTPTGTISVTDGTDSCTTGTLVSGAGSCQLTPTTSGAKILVATYSGDTNFAGSISAGVAQGVDP